MRSNARVQRAESAMRTPRLFGSSRCKTLNTQRSALHAACCSAWLALGCNMAARAVHTPPDASAAAASWNAVAVRCASTGTRFKSVSATTRCAAATRAPVAGARKLATSAAAADAMRSMLS